VSSRPSPTLRMRRLSRLLKDYREAAGMTAAEAAKRAGSHPATLSRLENRLAREIDPAAIETLLGIYGVDDKDVRRSLVRLAQDASQRGWWQAYRLPDAYDTFIGLEMEADVIREFAPLSIPALLQTEAYARAAIGGRGVRLSEREVAKYLTIRMQRQDRVMRDRDPVTLWAVLDESVLHRAVVADPGAMAAQMEALRKAADLRHVKLQVLPFSAGRHVGAGVRRPDR
jgi:transcriptional regulator with XRE-family HTH domain